MMDRHPNDRRMSAYLSGRTLTLDGNEWVVEPIFEDRHGCLYCQDHAPEGATELVLDTPEQLGNLLRRFPAPGRFLPLLPECERCEESLVAKNRRAFI